LAAERTRWVLAVQPPEGLGFSPPPDQDVAGPFGSYSRRTVRVADGWRITRTVSLAGGAVAPDRYPDLRAFLLRVDAADSEGWR